MTTKYAWHDTSMVNCKKKTNPIIDDVVTVQGWKQTPTQQHSKHNNITVANADRSSVSIRLVKRYQHTWLRSQ